MNKIKLYLILLIIIIATTLFIFNDFDNKISEPFNEKVGQFCITCKGKNYNQCLNCFNCGFCVDKWGNAQCIGGSHRGPYNFERCVRWYHGDPYAFMLQKNANRKCHYRFGSGPINPNLVNNRIIDI